ncbi:hypothetical protein GQ464_002310 [Rhodocaloribacter litoris]|uniref:hypothetical protein n=1 Tax=Rhodocaloribacter litoris TaxID=2558931 RepID=UPI001421AA47|nr:hypothetical protein [Rhodocaloribacter litoris]QXD15803.1 hypothetical protein GQ464_002310 [Rhodocaloribacter litoris]
MNDTLPDIPPPGALLDDLRRLIDKTRAAVVSTLTAVLTMLYGRIGWPSGTRAAPCERMRGHVTGQTGCRETIRSWAA